MLLLRGSLDLFGICIAGFVVTEMSNIAFDAPRTRSLLSTALARLDFGRDWMHGAASSTKRRALLSSPKSLPGGFRAYELDEMMSADACGREQGDWLPLSKVT